MVILFLLDLNIIFILWHPSNHSQTSTMSTLNKLTFTFNPLKWTRQTLQSNPLEFILSLSLLSTLTERVEGRGKFLYFSISVLCNVLRVISRLQLCSQFIFERGEGRWKFLYFSISLCYAMVWGWYKDYNYVRNLLFNLIMKMM